MGLKRPGLGLINANLERGSPEFLAKRQLATTNEEGRQRVAALRSAVHEARLSRVNAEKDTRASESTLREIRMRRTAAEAELKRLENEFKQLNGDTQSSGLASKLEVPSLGNQLRAYCRCGPR